MNYEEIKTPEELLEFMDEIEYGFQDDEVNRYGSWDENEFEESVLTKWKLSSPKRLLETKIGHCFDQVELERDWFRNHEYKFKTFYIMFLFDEPNDYSTHTFLIYEDKEQWKLFEHSDYFNRGIHVFNNISDALKFEMNYHIKENEKYNMMNEEIIRHLHIFEYGDIKYNVSFDDFINEILEKGKDITEQIDG